MIALLAILVGACITLALLAIFLPVNDPFVDGSDLEAEMRANAEAETGV